MTQTLQLHPAIGEFVRTPFGGELLPKVDHFLVLRRDEFLFKGMNFQCFFSSSVPDTDIKGDVVPHGLFSAPQPA